MDRLPFGRAIVGLLFGALCVLGGVVPAFGGTTPGPDSLAGLNATYNASANVRWTERKLSVRSTARVTNRGDAPVDALTFNAAPAKIGEMDLRSVRVGPDTVNATVYDQNIVVDLPAPLGVGGSYDVTIEYDSWFGSTSGNKQFLFAKVEDIATAYRWIPWLSRPYTFNTPTYGEPFVTKVSDEVRVSITIDQPSVKLATSGRLIGTSGNTRHYVANNVRDFNFAASPSYKYKSQVWNGVLINYYYVELPVSTIQSYAIGAMNRFSSLVGAYPYGQLAIAEVPTGPSMESPSMIWLTQKASARGNLRYLTVHELAHQWFYGVVGNDQADQPFADEALAEFLTRDYIGHRDSQCAESVLDKRVYDYSHSCYYEVIYVQGYNYLEDYRERVGDSAFWAGLREYYDSYRFRIGGTRSLLEILDEASSGMGGGHGTRFPSLYD